MPQRRNPSRLYTKHYRFIPLQPLSKWSNSPPPSPLSPSPWPRPSCQTL
ncbi:Putative protein of unknown function [Podospora comata]|uniref:Uncharacterized protein n=1 Tax=Podospora comata TaxID=48703 RepID=A0ABY6SKN0_PODCO|nr:Putative protein of unknown function [Podospora comata]